MRGTHPRGLREGRSGGGRDLRHGRPGRGSATTTLEFRCFRKCFLLKVNFRYHKTSACQGTDPATFSTFQMCHQRPHLVPKYCASAEGPCRRAAGKNVTKSTQQKRRREKHIAPREISSSCALTYQGSRSCPFMLNCGYIFICRGLTATQHGHQGAGESQTP